MKRLIPAILLMAAIFAFSSLPSTQLPEFGIWDLVVKKGGHMLGYGLLAMAYLYAIWREEGLRIWDLFRAWILAVIYAASDEFHQSFVPGRGATVVDVGIDALGAGMALLSYWGMMRKRKELPEFENQ